MLQSMFMSIVVREGGVFREGGRSMLGSRAVVRDMSVWGLAGGARGEQMGMKM